VATQDGFVGPKGELATSLSARVVGSKDRVEIDVEYPPARKVYDLAILG
jgi:hypothetical protein